MPIIANEYKGKPVLILKRNEKDKWMFTFGYTKAKMILENIDIIRLFVEEIEKEQQITPSIKEENNVF